MPGWKQWNLIDFFTLKSHIDLDTEKSHDTFSKERSLLVSMSNFQGVNLIFLGGLFKK